LAAFKCSWLRNYFLFSPRIPSPVIDFRTYLGVSIKLPLGAVFNFTNGPSMVERVGVEEFSLLGKEDMQTKEKSNKNS
jgi:hypothetical protein